jgi:hypothetical protein
MITKPREELSLLIRSGWRVIALETFEEDRAVAMVQRVAEGLERKCDTWSLATGFEGDAQSSGSFDAAIRAIAVRTSPALFVILDAHRVLDDPLAIRRLRDVLPTLAARKQALILLGPALDLPHELQREAGRLELPLPGEAELRALFQRVLDAAEVDEAGAALLDEAVRGSLGLTATESVRVFRKAIRVLGGLSKGVPELIVREKRRALRRTPSSPSTRTMAGSAKSVASANSSSGSANAEPPSAAMRDASVSPHLAGCCCSGFRAAGNRSPPKRSRRSGSFRCCASISLQRSAAAPPVPRPRFARRSR